ncbi:hypothetical protein V8E53_004873 [Lactarius tabidus]
MVACSLRFCRSNGALCDGVYDISANVVAYRHEAVTDNVVDANENVKLMGDILDFKPVPVLAEDPITACKIPARVSGSAMVSSVDKEHYSFTLFPTQHINASSKAESLPVRAVLEKGPKWPNPVTRLPSPCGFVAFTGKIAHFEENPGPIRSDLRSRIVVALDSIIYLRANYGSTELSNPPPSSHSQDADSVALKTCILKYSQSTTDSTLSQEDEDGED